jgi:hypothetical protein
VQVLRGFIIFLALSEAGWMTFDGNRALFAGDYVTVGAGPHAGELGAWSQLVERAGIEPRSILMKTIFAAYGIIWLFIIMLFALRKSLTWDLMLLAAILSLWYFPAGTCFSALQIVLLLVLRRSEAAHARSRKQVE